MKIKTKHWNSLVCDKSIKCSNMYITNTSLCTIGEHKEEDTIVEAKQRVSTKCGAIVEVYSVSGHIVDQEKKWHIYEPFIKEKL